ncbi:MAG: hypothetical protein R6V03_09360 [Kiritimatiellia bacterium]
MKRRYSTFPAAIILLCALFRADAGQRNWHVVSLGVRQHQDHEVITDYPFDDNDLSYGIAWEYHEPSAYWQIAADYCPDPTGTNTLEYVFTPQINLITKDQWWRGGLGVMWPYVNDSVEGTDWLDTYWQFILGLQLAATRVDLDVMTYYVFESWGDLSDFEFSDLEYGVRLGFEF